MFPFTHTRITLKPTNQTCYLPSTKKNAIQLSIGGIELSSQAGKKTTIQKV